jgi:hypothetical protein
MVTTSPQQYIMGAGAERIIVLALLVFRDVVVSFDNQVSFEYDNGSLNIVTMNGTVMVDQLDLKQAVVSLRALNDNLSSQLSASQSQLNASIQAQMHLVQALNRHLPERYFAGPSFEIFTAVVARSVYAADLDNDGDMDVLSASWDVDTIAWYRNNGSGAFSSRRIISTEASGASSVRAADLDNDGDMDVLSASYDDNKIAWYRNDGNGSFSSQLVISTAATAALSVHAADLDNDGDMDVLSASWGDSAIAWYPNNGNGTFSSRRIISRKAVGAYSVYAADLDNDGHMDVLSGSNSDNKIAWYRNMDGKGSFSDQRVISTIAKSVYFVYAADLDNDGDIDVLSASQDDGKIAWYRNNGSGTFSAQIIISIADGAWSVHAADLDNDGDMDVLSASGYDGKIAWYRNEYGSGSFSSKLVISASLHSYDVFAADFDNDGYLDMLGSSSDGITWCHNDFLGASD